MKQKTNKTLSKRVKITAKKKLIVGHAYFSHNKHKKTQSHIRRQKEPALLEGRFYKKLRRLLGV